MEINRSTHSLGEAQFYTFETIDGQLFEGALQMNDKDFYSPLLRKALKPSKRLGTGFISTLAANGAGGKELQFIEIIINAIKIFSFDENNKISKVYIHDGPEIMSESEIRMALTSNGFDWPIDIITIPGEEWEERQQRITGPYVGLYIAAVARAHSFGWIGTARVFASKPKSFDDTNSIAKLGGDHGNAASELDAIENAERVARDWIAQNRGAAT